MITDETIRKVLDIVIKYELGSKYIYHGGKFDIVELSSDDYLFADVSFVDIITSREFQETFCKYLFDKRKIYGDGFIVGYILFKDKTELKDLFMNAVSISIYYDQLEYFFISLTQ